MTEQSMTARQWIGRARGISREIEMLEKALEDARDSMLKITQNYDSDGAQSTKDPHKMDRLAEYMDMIRAKQNELFQIKAEITEAIYRLPDMRYRTALFEYYINGLTWEEVAAKTHYSWRNTLYIRKRALQEFENLFISLQYDRVL